MFCKNCGAELKADTKFCTACGSNQEVKEVDVASFDFHSWIVENSLEAYEEILQSQDLNSLEVLVSLTPEDLTNLGIDTIGARKKFLNAIQNLKTYDKTNTYSSTKENISESSDIPTRCPRCGNFWGKDTETSGAGNTLGKAVVGALLLGPIGAVGGAAFGNKTIVYSCRKCGFTKEYKSSIVKGAAKEIKKIFK